MLFSNIEGPKGWKYGWREWEKVQEWVSKVINRRILPCKIDSADGYLEKSTVSD